MSHQIREQPEARVIGRQPPAPELPPADDTTTTTPDPTTGTTTDPTTGTTTGTTTEGLDTTTGTSSTTDGATETATTDEEPCVSDDRAIKLGRLVNPKDGTVLENAIVVVHGDRISQVTTDEDEIPCGAQIIDWTAYTGLPGLVDAHTHFAYQTDQEPNTTAWERRNWLHQNAPLVLVEEARKAALATLKKGVTTTIDKGAGNLEYAVVTVRNEINAGKIPGPRIFHAWKGIWWYDGITLGFIKSWIDQQVLHGADLLKIWADGCSDKTLDCVPSFTLEELTTAVDHAHSLGKRIAIHAYHADTAKLAILAGADSIEHPEGLEETDFFDMIDKDVVYVPTIAHNEYYGQNLELFGYPPELVP
ncbi:amidohydrolase family protein [Nannocystis pusilla]|uniref:amidohydrolase family protein n=1 Tax=Nannocystis pusilla TaxID=889268 RepID=UPI003B81B0E8